MQRRSFIARVLGIGGAIATTAALPSVNQVKSVIEPIADAHVFIPNGKPLVGRTLVNYDECSSVSVCSAFSDFDGKLSIRLYDGISVANG